LRFEDGFLPSTLVALGRFEKAYGLIGDYWYSFERVPSLSCVEAGKDERAIRTRSRRVTNPCVTLTEAGKQNGKDLDIPEIAEPHLALLADIDAPSHYEDDATRVAGSALELRLVSSEGGKLVSFWEAPRFQIPTFPPFTIGKGGWAKTSYTAEHAPRPNPIQFVLDAMDGV
jgi:hypothetical protein